MTAKDMVPMHVASLAAEKSMEQQRRQGSTVSVCLVVTGEEGGPLSLMDLIMPLGSYLREVDQQLCQRHFIAHTCR